MAGYGGTLEPLQYPENPDIVRKIRNFGWALSMINLQN
jgi:hypothetical protein